MKHVVCTTLTTEVTGYTTCELRSEDFDDNVVFVLMDPDNNATQASLQMLKEGRSAPTPNLQVWAPVSCNVYSTGEPDTQMLGIKWKRLVNNARGRYLDDELEQKIQ